MRASRKDVAANGSWASIATATCPMMRPKALLKRRHTRIAPSGIAVDPISAAANTAIREQGLYLKYESLYEKANIHAQKLSHRLPPRRPATVHIHGRRLSSSVRSVTIAPIARAPHGAVSPGASVASEFQRHPPLGHRILVCAARTNGFHRTGHRYPRSLGRRPEPLPADMSQSIEGSCSLECLTMPLRLNHTDISGE